MTFKTTEQNTFKKNLNGLEYKQTEYRPVKFTEWVMAGILVILIIVCLKECNSDKVELAYSQIEYYS